VIHLTDDASDVTSAARALDQIKFIISAAFASMLIEKISCVVRSQLRANAIGFSEELELVCRGKMLADENLGKIHTHARAHVF
jgi:hypothetical protein